jgi:S1-C subfamily serine protease
MCHLLVALLIVADAKDIPQDVQASALRATVRISNPATDSTGSGVVIKQDADFVFVLTARHVIDRADKVQVHTFSALSYPQVEKTYDAEIVAESRAKDLAVVRVSTRDKFPAVLPVCAAAKAPTDKDFAAVSVGCDGGKAPTCRAETVKGRKAVRRPGEEVVVSWEVENAPAAGRSGGPLVDRRGYVIGIASGANGDRGYYVHPEEIVRFLKKHVLEELAGEDKK